MKSESKKDAAKGNDLPGYPHYKENEDITSQEKRADLDVERLSRANKNPAAGLNEIVNPEKAVDYSPEIVPGTEADVTIDDLKNLGPLNSDMDEGEDETLLPNVAFGPDFSGDDLDVPGAEDDDEAEARGSEDEENNYYSRGQD